ncbi:MAG: Stp1/IreP family PP2C-type Ser/Thr phosphatase [Ktedonobacteraceae bacterium]|nr:Stp1/IreP family PP2C-type Ser/Thr phosphatase [Ktedonobacteraceae bacterium]
MSKQLHLDVAQLTDVGRRRPHNEDNMAYVIPKDPQVMARKGALFIVADGMGGHAAGEVASEIAVDTVSTFYYQDESDDILVSLVRSIKRANTLIHQRAAENMSRSGMGTTCVVAILRGDMACIANVGDSRAYLVRRGQGKQVSQDHSWVEEQVRAGLLSQEQARSHAQRNVITRSLGTQPDVEVDIFTEKLEDGDTLVLCSDGLSGMVGDEELHSIVDQYVPRESVYRLIERANENGGADNITAIVVHVLETGAESPPIRYPVHVGGREASDEATAILGRVPSTPLGLSSHPNGEQVNGGMVQGSPSFQPVAIPRSPLGEAVAPRRKRSRLFYPLVTLLVLVVLIALGGGYMGWRQFFAPVDIDGNLNQATTLVNRAKAEMAGNPPAALNDLSSAQERLQVVQNGGSLNAAQQKRFDDLVRVEFTPAVQAAITNYNQQGKIYTLPCTTTTNAPINTGSTNTQAGNIGAIRGDKDKQFSYTLGDDHNLYRVDDQHSLVDLSKPAGDGAQYTSIFSTSQHLLALVALPGKNNSQVYSLNVLTAGADGKLTINQTNGLDSYTKNGQEPKLITAWENGSEHEVYVVLTSPNAQNQATILDFPLGPDHKLGKPRQKSISVSSNPIGIAAFPKGQLFLQYSDGSIQGLQFNSNQPASSVIVQHPIAAPLSIAAKDFTFKMAVPKAEGTGQNPAFLALPLPPSPRTTFMLSGMINNTPHLFIVDGMYYRVLDLQVAQTPSAATPTVTATDNGGTGGGVVSSAPVTMALNQQYASSSLLNLVRGVALDPKTPSTLYLTSAKDGAPTNLVMLDTSSKNSCGTS